MPSAFADIAFTETVKAVQTRMGSRAFYRQFDQEPLQEPVLGQREMAFIRARDSFYQGTVSESGWPYVQHRGGPAGFLKVLDARTIAYADFSGNRQYISTGNLGGDDRVSLFLMDYAQQARLKILGRARVLDPVTDAALLARLDNPHYRARVERGIAIAVEGFDWNCPKYITPRYTDAELAERVSPALSVQHDTSEEPIGSGELALTVSGVRQLTPRVRAYELRAEDWGELPPAGAGAHLAVPVRAADGSVITRQYSLVMDPQRRNVYEIAVLREDDGRGGSLAIHDSWRVGTRLRAAAPVNHFPLHPDARATVLMAGGIGITPLLSMARALHGTSRTFELHYAGRTRVDMAFHDQVGAEFPGRGFTYLSRAAAPGRLDVAAVLQRAARDAVVYVCGPDTLIESVRDTATHLGMAPGRVQYESFS